MWASVQTIRGCPKHCSFCSVWRTDGQKPRQRKFQNVVDEIIALRRLGFRFIALADDNFYPVTFTDLRLAREQGNTAKLDELTAIRNERLQLMEELAKLPKDMVFFTQMTMEAGEDGSYLDAMRKANIKGALVGVEAVTPEGLKAVYKDWNYSGEALAKQLQTFKQHGVHVLGSFIFGLPTDRPATFDRHGRNGAQGRRHLRPICHDDSVSRHRRFRALGKRAGRRSHDGGRRAHHALLDDSHRSAAQNVYAASHHELRRNSRAHAKSLGPVLHLGSHLGTVCLHTDSARPARIHLPLQALPADVCRHRHLHRQRAAKEVEALGPWTARQCKKLFQARPMPELEGPKWEIGLPALGQAAFEGGGPELNGPFVVVSKR
jgi:hypothetical protein